MVDVAAIIADGVVDVEEAEGLREELYADGVIDREEADALFEINNAVSGNANCQEYEDLFVEALTDFVLSDEESPGVVDKDEAEYLISKIKGDGQVDYLELRLLDNIIENAEEVHPSLIDFRASC